jgi:hypothetical protein
MRPSPRGGSSPRAVAMIGAGTFELGVGLPLAALILYLVFRNQA